jgi:hypothetical protein
MHQAHWAKLCFVNRKDETSWNLHTITAALLRMCPLFWAVSKWATTHAVYFPDARIAISTDILYNTLLSPPPPPPLLLVLLLLLPPLLLLLLLLLHFYIWYAELFVWVIIMMEPPLTAVDSVYCVQGTRRNQYGRHVPGWDDGLHRYIASLKKQKHKYRGLRNPRLSKCPYLWSIRDICVQGTEKKNKVYNFVL